MAAEGGRKDRRWREGERDGTPIAFIIFAANQSDSTTEGVTELERKLG